MINKIRTFQTNDEVYNAFKKTCINNDQQLGYVLTDFMNRYNQYQILREEYLIDSTRTNSHKTPDLFERKDLWTQFFIHANFRLCKDIRKQLEVLTKLAEYYEGMSKYAESIDWEKEFASNHDE